MLAVPEAAWLAGVVDSEGCLVIVKYGQAKCKYPSYQLRLMVEMTHEQTIEKIRGLTGVGSVIKRPARVNMPKSRPAFIFTAHQRDAAQLLKQIHPYMVTKKEEADIALEFIQKCSLPPGSKNIGPDITALREQYKQALSLAKGRL